MEDNQYNSAILDSLVLYDATVRDILRVREIELHQYGLTHVQARVFYLLLKMKEPVKISDISVMLSRKPHSTSELISRMEKNGLVKKTRVPPGRTTIVSITEKGRDIWGNLPRKSLEMVFSALNDEERQQIDEYMGRLRGQARDLLGMDHVPPFLA